MAEFSLMIVYEKREQLRYTSILNLQTAMFRLLRRCRIKLVFSSGFHPQPKMRFPCPLPLGFEGLNEVLEIDIAEKTDTADILQSLHKHTLPGLVFKSIEGFIHQNKNEHFNPHAALYHLKSLSKNPIPRSFVERAERFMNLSIFVKERRGKKYDLRPLVYKLGLIDQSTIMMRLSAQSNLTGRPDEVIEALGFNQFDYLYSRVHFLDENFNKIP